MNELEFAIEFNSEDLYETTEAALFREADGRLYKLADGHSDLSNHPVEQEVMEVMLAESPQRKIEYGGKS